jgi:hypothetical protein
MNMAQYMDARLTFLGARKEWAGFAIDGVGIRHVRWQTHGIPLLHNLFYITMPPFSEHQDVFVVGLRERIWGSLLGQNDNRTINRGSEPKNVSVPP